MLISFSHEKDERRNIQLGDFGKVKSYIRSELNNNKNNASEAFFAAIDTLANNPIWLDRFTKSFNLEMGTKAKFQVFTAEEKEEMKKVFTVTGGASGGGLTPINDLFETTILPIADGLFFDTNTVLSQVTTIDAGKDSGNQSYALNEFADEKDAEDLAELAAGTEVDDAPRDGDTITPKNKVQASTSFSEYALMTMTPDLYGKYMARLMKRLQNRLVYNIFKGSNASNQFKGIINTAGSTEDDQEGALTFTDASSTDNIDLMLRMQGDLPDAVTDQEESKFQYFCKRNTWYKRALITQDLQQNYKLKGVIDDTIGNRNIGGSKINLINGGLNDGEVVFCDLSNYYMARKGPIQFKSDEGIVKLKEGQVTLVCRVYADGGMVFAHKNKVGSGAGANDNKQRNLFRKADLSA